ncbi:MAG: hypothetical protein WDA29_08185 [Flavobacteriaceae bacterium]
MKDKLKNITGKVKNFLKKMFKFDNAIGVYHGTLFLGALGIVSVEFLDALLPKMYVYLLVALGGTVAYFLLLRKAAAIESKNELVEDNKKEPEEI